MWEIQKFPPPREVLIHPFLETNSLLALHFLLHYSDRFSKEKYE